MPESPIRHSGCPFWTHSHLGEGVDHGGIDVGVGVEVEGPQGLLAGELGGLDPAFGPASGAIVALGKQ